jgi:hypothetical protein
MIKLRAILFLIITLISMPSNFILPFITSGFDLFFRMGLSLLEFDLHDTWFTDQVHSLSPDRGTPLFLGS